MSDEKCCSNPEAASSIAWSAISSGGDVSYPAITWVMSWVSRLSPAGPSPVPGIESGQVTASEGASPETIHSPAQELVDAAATPPATPDETVARGSHGS